MRWLANDARGPVDYRIRSDWTFRCPRNAAERAFYLQVQDPPQVREFDDFVQYVRTAGRLVLLDIGSHFGVFCFAAVHYGAAGSRALAVDPSGEAREMVERIAALNGWNSTVTFLQAAAGAQDGTLEMVETGLTGAGYLVLPKDHPQADRRRLPMHTVETLVRQLGEPPTVVKVDVEGFELDVLHGGPVTFGQRRTPLFLEIHNAMMRERGLDPAEVVRHLRSLGYNSFQIGGRELPDAELSRPDVVRVFARASGA